MACQLIASYITFYSITNCPGTLLDQVFQNRKKPYLEDVATFLKTHSNIQLGLLLYPWKFQTEESSTPRNSIPPNFVTPLRARSEEILRPKTPHIESPHDFYLDHTAIKLHVIFIQTLEIILAISPTLLEIPQRHNPPAFFSEIVQSPKSNPSAVQTGCFFCSQNQTLKKINTCSYLSRKYF